MIIIIVIIIIIIIIIRPIHKRKDRDYTNLTC